MSEKVLVLRNCDQTMRAYGGFKWPVSGFVQALDWSPEPTCGEGLHGWLWGRGDVTLGYFSGQPGVKWLVVEVDAASIVDLNGKVKFPSGNVVYCGTLEGATQYIIDHGGDSDLLNYHTKLIASDTETTQIAKSCVAVSQTDGKTIGGDNRSTLVARSYSNLKVGIHGTIVANDDNSIFADRFAKVVCEDDNTVELELGCKLIAESGTTATVGRGSTAIVEYRSTVKCDSGCTVVVKEECEVVAGDNCNVIGSYDCNLVAGADCLLFGLKDTKFTGDVGTMFVTRFHGVHTAIVSAHGPVYPGRRYRYSTRNDEWELC